MKYLSNVVSFSRQTVWLHSASTSLLELVVLQDSPSTWLITPTKHQSATFGCGLVIVLYCICSAILLTCPSITGLRCLLYFRVKRYY